METNAAHRNPPKFLHLCSGNRLNRLTLLLFFVFHGKLFKKLVRNLAAVTIISVFVQVVPVMLHLLTSISSVRLYIPKDLRPFDNRQLMLKSIQVHNAAMLKQRYRNC